MSLLWREITFGKPTKKIKLDNNYFEKIDDTEKVWKIFVEVLNCNNKLIELDFSECTNISNTGLTILASLGILCSKENKTVAFKFKNNSEWANKLTKNLSISSNNKHKLKGIPFQHINSEKEVLDMINNLKYIEKITNSDKASEISSKLYELCINAIEHGKNEMGAVCIGNCYEKYFTFTVFDFGEGIIEKVKSHIKGKISDEEALKWAFASSNSTEQSLEFPRGAGFTTIFNFIQKCNGQFMLYTSDIYCIYKNTHHYKKLDVSVPGTLITVTVKI